MSLVKSEISNNDPGYDQLLEDFAIIREHGIEYKPGGDNSELRACVLKDYGLMQNLTGGQVHIDHRVPQNPELDPSNSFHREYIIKLGLSLTEKTPVTPERIIEEALFPDVPKDLLPNFHARWNLAPMLPALNIAVSNGITSPIATLRESMIGAAHVAAKEIRKELAERALEYDKAPSLHIPEIPRLTFNMILPGGVVNFQHYSEAKAAIETELEEQLPGVYRLDLEGTPFNLSGFLGVVLPDSGSDAVREIPVQALHFQDKAIQRFAELYGVLEDAFNQASKETVTGQRYESQGFVEVEGRPDFMDELKTAADELGILIDDIENYTVVEVDKGQPMVKPNSALAKAFEEQFAQAEYRGNRLFIQTDGLDKRLEYLKDEIEKRANIAANEYAAFSREHNRLGVFDPSRTAEVVKRNRERRAALYQRCMKVA